MALVSVTFFAFFSVAAIVVSTDNSLSCTFLSNIAIVNSMFVFVSFSSLSIAVALALVISNSAALRSLYQPVLMLYFRVLLA